MSEALNVSQPTQERDGGGLWRGDPVFDLPPLAVPGDHHSLLSHRLTLAQIRIEHMACLASVAETGLSLCFRTEGGGYMSD